MVLFASYPLYAQDKSYGFWHYSTNTSSKISPVQDKNNVVEKKFLTIIGKQYGVTFDRFTKTDVSPQIFNNIVGNSWSFIVLTIDSKTKKQTIYSNGIQCSQTDFPATNSVWLVESLTDSKNYVLPFGETNTVLTWESCLSSNEVYALSVKYKYPNKKITTDTMK